MPILLFDAKRPDSWELLQETNRNNLRYQLDRNASTTRFNNWNNTKDVEMVLRHDFYAELTLTEDTQYVPRFSLKKQANPLFAAFPPNKEMKYDQELMLKAIGYGMILMIQYRGETGDSKDDFVQGHSRAIYPLVLGTSAKGDPLLRGFHLRGWSVAHNGNIQKEWRMFRPDRILSMSFTGSFFRLPPLGYEEQDSGMKGGIIKAANFDEIRKNQKSLLTSNVIQNKKEVVFDDKGKVVAIQIDNTNTKLDLKNPFENPNVKESDKSQIRMTFLKSVATNQRIAVLGALGQKGNRVKLTSRGKYLGIYTVLRNCMGDMLGKDNLQMIENASEYELWVYLKRLN